MRSFLRVCCNGFSFGRANFAVQFQVKCRTHANCARKRSLFSSRTTNICCTTPMRRSIRARFVGAHSKSYQRCTTTNASTAVRSRTNARRAVCTFYQYFIGETMNAVGTGSFSRMGRSIETLAQIWLIAKVIFTCSFHVRACTCGLDANDRTDKCFRQRVSYLVHRRIHVSEYVVIHRIDTDCGRLASQNKS